MSAQLSPRIPAHHQVSRSQPDGTLSPSGRDVWPALRPLREAIEDATGEGVRGVYDACLFSVALMQTGNLGSSSGILCAACVPTQQNSPDFRVSPQIQDASQIIGLEPLGCIDIC